MDGIINIYKEKDFTSHDVVAKARGILKQRKIGHTGTLDPDAEGVLPICIGKATKVVPYLTDADKCYEAEVILGAYTTTEDATGDIVESFEVVGITTQLVEEVVQSFLGEYTQIPPMYSAIKVNGTRLYELARQGITIDRPARDVMIYKIETIEPLRENKFKIRVQCSKGTYIRTLCTDIGKKLGCGAHMGNLLRTKVGNYLIKDSITLSELEKVRDNPPIQQVEDIFMQYESVTIKETANKALYNGNPLTMNDIQGLTTVKTDLVRVHDYNDKFVGVYKIRDNKLIVEKIFL
ncbi:MAG: tRNA pseudouridine(55) synthase TruB [Epulopiscium sp. Nele67-Bin004]|nr:MAG: tRNA pseudouridine(55) synthase TruB [Epulopiscium sp. Nele67-Bin004]